jgi:photosystem II stability/assembly factor-like uncharacterized protein
MNNEFRTRLGWILAPLLALTALAVPGHAQESGGSPLAGQAWLRLGGPLGGLGYDIRVRPDNPDIMYVTDAWAGVHKSADGGLTWFPLNEGIDLRTGPSGDAIPVFCLTIDPNNYDIVWIGLQNLGAVYRSADGGQTWEKRVRGIVEGEGLTIRGISVEPGNSDVVYLAGEISSWRWAGGERWGREFDRTRGVVYKSTDGGLSWQAVWRGDNLARYIWINPQDVNTLYISTGIFDREAANSDPATNTPGGEGVLKSTDGGKTWAQANEGLSNLYIGSLFMHPENPEVLLAGAGNNAYPQGGGVYLTTDGGAHWRHVAAEHITSVEFAPGNPLIAYAGGNGDFFRSEDGGQTWVRLLHPRGWGWGPDGIRPGFPIDFQVDPRHPGRIFVNNYGGGNFLSEGGGETWVAASTGYTGADLTDIAVDPRSPAIVYVNGRSGPFVSRDGGVTWQGINPIEIRDIAEGARVALDPADSNHVLLSSAHWGWTYESMDGGSTWRLATDFGQELQNLPLPDTNQKFQGMQAITFAPSDPKIVYGGFGVWRCAEDAEPMLCNTVTFVSLLRSDDGGRNWQRLTANSLEGLTVTEIVVHPADPATAWAATAGAGVFRTTDGGETWESASNGLWDMVMDIAISPQDPQVLFAATAGQGVFKSEDGGSSWRPGSAGMDPNEQIGSIVIDPVRPHVLYAGSWRSGVFLSEDDGATWRLIIDGLRTRSVRALAISSDGQTLYAATRGEGVFRLSTLNQTDFEDLAPTPTSIPPTPIPPTPVPPTRTPSVSPTQAPTVAPTGEQPAAAPSGGLPCLGGALPLALIGWVWRRRRK